MKGLELCRRYWEEVGRPAFEQGCPEVLERAAVGLAGEGSECFGYDDDISRDHDWGPGFCIWFSEEDMRRFGERAGSVYSSLPTEYMGYRRLREDVLSAGRVGVMGVWDFYSRFIGLRRPPESLMDWRIMPEAGLATAVNGEVFFDALGEFSAMRETLKAGYPEQLRLKKLAARCAVAAQAGQYNYARCLKRGETVAAVMAAAEFIGKAQSAVFLLENRYRPYYKWSQRAMKELGPEAAETGAYLDLAAERMDDCESELEGASAKIIAMLKKRGLSRSNSDFLLDHAREIQAGISDPVLSRIHLMSE